VIKRFHKKDTKNNKDHKEVLNTKLQRKNPVIPAQAGIQFVEIFYFWIPTLSCLPRRSGAQAGTGMT
jgi:hypothetical protein